MQSTRLLGTTPNEVLARGAAAADQPLSRPVRTRVQPLVAVAEGLAYSSGLAALVGGGMTWAVGRALASSDAPRDAALVACGAFLVYNVDRLRDLERDRRGAPGRTAFIERNRSRLAAAAAIAGLLLLACLAAAPGPAITLCLAVGAIGFLHRRLKQDIAFKIAYVTATWTAACVGLPWLGRVGASSALPGGLGWPLLFVGSAVASNLIASNLRDGKRGAASPPPVPMLRAARGIAIATAALAAFAPQAVAPLAWIPAAEAVSLCFFRSTERFGHFAVDGALLFGALIAIVQAST